MKLPVVLLIAAGAAAVTLPASANEFAPAMQTYLEDEIMSWIESPEILDAIRAQNQQTGSWSQDQIDAADTEWRAEVGQTSTPTIDTVIQTPAAEFLRHRVDDSAGRITEIFTMDAKGLNVAASDITSDFWQGDEAKHQLTYGAGPGAVHMSEVEFDESTQTYQGQISVTIVDPDTGAPIGAITIGVDAESFL